MQICEFYRNESVDVFGYFEGRWIWTTKFTDQGLCIEWTDLFGHQDKTIFHTGIPHTVAYFFYPLTKNFGLFQLPGTAANNELFWGAKLHWENTKCELGNVPFEPLGDYESSVVIDRASPLPNGDIYFLIYFDDSQHLSSSKHWYCHLDVNTLRIIPHGEPFLLISNDYNCIDLNGDLISGINKSLTEIKRFNVRTRQFVVSIQVNGLPLNIRCLRHLRPFENDRPTQIDSAGAWTNNRLFIWSEEGSRDAARSIIYYIELDTGATTAISHTFNNLIRRLIIDPKGQHLYIRNDELIGFKCRNWSNKNRELDSHRRETKRFRYFRIPINNPETLFFLASMAIPRPLTQITTQIIISNCKEVVPVQIYK